MDKLVGYIEKVLKEKISEYLYNHDTGFGNENFGVHFVIAGGYHVEVMGFVIVRLPQVDEFKDD